MIVIAVLLALLGFTLMVCRMAVNAGNGMIMSAGEQRREPPAAADGVHADAARRVDPDRTGHPHVHLVGEAGGVLDPVQVRSGRTSDHRLGRHPQHRCAAREGMVPVEPGVGVDVLVEADPGRPAKLVPGEEPAPDGVRATEDPPGEGGRAMRS
ncbi:hypothetical protein [Micromonospora halophytica]|uniref:Uncharacterized protein n=1 Tax=Micromonospora halophytica TaxID=47864 RepID=A0A1C5IFY0_9ACTN|nr:hypothetical protein [Micromonospora halophytica]SCG56911.1 hypothetical protein GA0070560_110185 [Micromonospora halophytica]